MHTLDRVVMALGYFDSLHVGHREVINSAKKLAKQLNAKLVIFTFKGNLRAVLNGEEEKYVYSFAERERLLVDLGVDKVHFEPTDFDFLSMGKLAFLNKLNKEYNIVGYVCGKDYKFGKFASGSVLDLEKYAKEKNQALLTVDDVVVNGKKVSTTLIKSLLLGGEIEKANEILQTPYFISGKVFKDRGVGEKIGFPTANIKLDREKQCLKDGVYAGIVSVDGKEYKAIINCGNRPTFMVNEEVIEAHLLDFEGDLYGKDIKIEFIKFIRNIVKFRDSKELVCQLKKDILIAEEIND